MQLAIGIMTSALCGGLAGACVSVAFSRVFHWRELRTKFYSVLNNMISAYVIRMENLEGRYWTTVVGNLPAPEDEDFVDHRSSFMSDLVQYNELKEERILRKQLLDNAMSGNHNAGEIATLDLAPESTALHACLITLHKKLKFGQEDHVSGHMGSHSEVIPIADRRMVGRPGPQISGCRKLAHQQAIIRGNVIAESSNFGLSLWMRDKSDQLVTREKISEFKRRRIRSVRAVRAIVPDARAEVAADRAWRGLGGIGCAHCFTPLENRAFRFERQHDDLARAHEFGQLGEKPSFPVHGVETFGIFAGEPQGFDRDDLESSLINP
jgi:hypothetical protein